MLDRKIRERPWRWFWIGAWSAVVLLCAAPAHSAGARRRSPGKRDAGRACVASYNNALNQEQAGHLREARELWAKCARPTCSAFLQHECGARYTLLDGDIPTVVPLVTTEAGEPVTDVKVVIDGEVVASGLDGRALSLDPGLHEIVLTSSEGTHTEKVLVAQGQRNRQLAVVLHGEKPAPREVPAGKAEAPLARVSPARLTPAKLTPARPTAARLSPPRPLAAGEPAAEATENARVDLAASDESPRHAGSGLTYVLAGAGLAGAGAFALLTYWGRKDNAALGGCSPHCPQTSIDHVRRLYFAADLSLGAGVAALVAAYWVHRASSHAEPEDATKREAYLFNLQPTRSGALASVSGSF